MAQGGLEQQRCSGDMMGRSEVGLRTFCECKSTVGESKKGRFARSLLNRPFWELTGSDFRAHYYWFDLASSRLWHAFLPQLWCIQLPQGLGMSHGWNIPLFLPSNTQMDNGLVGVCVCVAVTSIKPSKQTFKGRRLCRIASLVLVTWLLAWNIYHDAQQLSEESRTGQSRWWDRMSRLVEEKTQRGT